MRRSSPNRILMFSIIAAFAFIAGCHHQVASKPAVTQPPQPTVAPPAKSSAPVSASNTPSPAPQPAPGPSDAQLFQQDVKDAYFDYNKADIRSDDRSSLTTDAEFFRAHPEIKFTIEGHCDERGSEEYNLGLGDRRASSAKRYLVSLGIPEDHIQTTSYGKERPFCSQENESCWSQNRRAHFAMSQ